MCSAIRRICAWTTPSQLNLPFAMPKKCRTCKHSMRVDNRALMSLNVTAFFETIATLRADCLEHQRSKKAVRVHTTGLKGDSAVTSWRCIQRKIAISAQGSDLTPLATATMLAQVPEGRHGRAIRSKS